MIGQDSTDQESSHTDLTKGHDREASGTDSMRKHDQGLTDDIDAIRRHSEVIVTKHCTSQNQSRSTSASSTPRKLSPLLTCPPRRHLSSSSSVTPDVTSPTTKQRGAGDSEPKLQILPPEGEHPHWELQCVEWSACMHAYMGVKVHMCVYYSMVRCTAMFSSAQDLHPLQQALLLQQCAMIPPLHKETVSTKLCQRCMESCLGCVESCLGCMESCLGCMESCLGCMESCLGCMESCLGCMESCLGCMESCLGCMESCLRMRRVELDGSSLMGVMHLIFYVGNH